MFRVNIVISEQHLDCYSDNTTYYAITLQVKFDLDIE